MEYVIGGLALLFLLFVLFVVAGVVATVKAVQAVRGGIQRTTRQVRRTVDDVTLRAKSTQPGPVGELARLRLGLRTSLDATRQALQSHVRTDASLREALRLLDRLEGHARQLDGELRLLMDEPNRRRVAARLPEVRARADRIRNSADSLRWAAQDRARRLDEEALGTLDEQIRLETDALRHWEQAQSGTGATDRAASGAGTAPTPPADPADPTSPKGAAETPQAALPRTTPGTDPLDPYLRNTPKTPHRQQRHGAQRPRGARPDGNA